MYKISFGECLKYLLSAQDISMSRLSKAINVDSSLVNRWIHNKRVPAYDTTYIENIAEFLSKNVYNSYHVDLINELYTKFCDFDEEMSMIDKIKKVLYESQGYSINFRKKYKKVSTKVNKGYKNSFEENFNISYEIVSEYSIEGISGITNEKIIQGTENILSAFIHLLKDTSDHNNIKNKKIYITYNNFDISDIPQETLKIAYYYLQNLIENGWTICFILKLNMNIKRILSFIDYTLPLLMTGKVNFYCYNRHELFTTEREIFVATDVATLSCFPSKPNSIVDWAFYMQNKVSVNVITNFIEIIIESHTRQIIEYYNESMLNKLSSFITRTIEQDNNQYNYNSGFNFIFLTKKLYMKLLIRLKLPYESVLFTMLYYEKIYNGIIQNLKKNQHFSIFYASNIEYILQNREINLFTHLGNRVVNLESGEVLECIENIIDFIMSNQNYSIAILHQNIDSFSHISTCNYMIKEKKAVIFDLHDSSIQQGLVNFSINEPTIIKAFEEHFINVWDKVSPIDKYKSEIISWLKRCYEKINNA